MEQDKSLLLKTAKAGKFIIKNNRFVREENAMISIKERGFLFGDGVFETCKIHNKAIYNFENHYERIKRGLAALKINLEIDELEKKSYSLIKKNQINNGILRISISRGQGSIGYLPTYSSKALTIIQTIEEKDSVTKPAYVKLGISSIKKSPSSLLLAQCKTSQALPFILTKIEAKELGLFDCIMLSQKGFISETSSANIFWIKNKKIFTPSINCDILPGTIRKKMFEIFPGKIIETEANIDTIALAEEIFLTNAAILALPVNELIIGNNIIKMNIKYGLDILKSLKEDMPNSSLKEPL